MIYELVPVTMPLLNRVCLNLWDRGRQELRQMGLTPMAAYRIATEWAAQEGARSGVLLADGNPLLATGIAVDNGTAFTWFLATEQALDHMLAVTRMLRRELKAWGGPVVLKSACVHPDTPRWFRALGFRHVGDAGMLHIYRRE